MLKLFLGKYKVLVLAISMFVFLNIGVLVLNNYVDQQVEQHAMRVDLGMRQMTLTQQMVQASLYIWTQKLQGRPYESGVEELRAAYHLFDQTLKALTRGGVVTAVDSDELITIGPVIGDDGQAILAQANDYWQRLNEAYVLLARDLKVTDEELGTAKVFYENNRGTLFALMKDLVDHCRMHAARQSSVFDTWLMSATILGALNLIFIVFFLIRNLAKRDDQLLIAKHEADQILETIDEGVMLLNRDLKIGSQYSRYLRELFAGEEIGRQNFDVFMHRYFRTETAEMAIEYVKLFFNERMRSDLINELNPLHHVKATALSKQGQLEEHYLDFSFAKIERSEQGETVLVTIKDVTAHVKLEQQTRAADSQTQQQLIVLGEILSADVEELDEFVTDYEASLEKMNTTLRKNSKGELSHAGTINTLIKQADLMRARANSLGLYSVTSRLTRLTDEVRNLAQKNQVKGRDFLPLTTKLRSLIEGLENIHVMREKLRQYDARRKAA